MVIVRHENQLPAWSRWSGDRAAEALQDAIEEIGHVPTLPQYMRFATGRDEYPSQSTLRRAFGSWSVALETAGTNPTDRFGDVEEAIAHGRELGLLADSGGDS